MFIVIIIIKWQWLLMIMIKENKERKNPVFLYHVSITVNERLKSPSCTNTQFPFNRSDTEFESHGQRTGHVSRGGNRWRWCRCQASVALHICIPSWQYLHVQRGYVNRTSSRTQAYGVVPKGLLTFLGSLYKEAAKTTSGTLVYRFERQTARKDISSFEKQCPRLRM